MKNIDPRHYDIIVAPVVTEKATVASEHNKVVFRVAAKATKPQIKEAVEKLFDVKVKAVNTLIRKGKVKRFRGTAGLQSDVKKAAAMLLDPSVTKTEVAKHFSVTRVTLNEALKREGYPMNPAARDENAESATNV